MKTVKYLIVAVIFFIFIFGVYCKKSSNGPQNGSQNINFNEHQIDLNFAGIHSIRVFDLDGDGDKDIIGGSEDTPVSRSNGIAWWRNDGGNPPSWTRFTVDLSFQHVMSVNVGYIDNDDFPDIIATSWSLHQIAWWKNSGDPTLNWTNNIIRSNFTNAHDARCFDINQDGHTDIAGISSSGAVIAGYNSGSNPPGWDFQILSSTFDGGKSVVIFDIDKDGDADILGTACDANKIAWWENPGDNTASWAYHLIGHFTGAGRIDIIDMNNDGLYDVIGTSWKSNELSYWICQDLMNDQWEKTTVTNDLDVAGGGLGNDFDRDGDIDIIAIGKDPGILNLYINNNFSWTRQTLKSNFRGGTALSVDDLDNDGDFDIIAGASMLGNLYWWENDSSK